MLLALLAACSTSATNGNTTDASCVTVTDARYHALQKTFATNLAASPGYQAAVTFVTKNLPAIQAFLKGVADPNIEQSTTIDGRTVDYYPEADAAYVSRSVFVSGGTNFGVTVWASTSTHTYSQEVMFVAGDSTWSVHRVARDSAYYDYGFDLPFVNAAYRYTAGRSTYTLAATAAGTTLTAQRRFLQQKTLVADATLDGEAVCKADERFWPELLPFPAEALHVEDVATSLPGIVLDPELVPITMRVDKIATCTSACCTLAPSDSCISIPTN